MGILKERYSDRVCFFFFPEMDDDPLLRYRPTLLAMTTLCCAMSAGPARCWDGSERHRLVDEIVLRRAPEGARGQRRYIGLLPLACVSS